MVKGGPRGVKWLLKAALLADSGSQCLAVFSLPAGRDSRPPELSAPASLASWDVIFFPPLSMGSQELVDAAHLSVAAAAVRLAGSPREVENRFARSVVGRGG